MANRFPSSGRVNNDYFVANPKHRPAYPDESGEGLPQIVSPGASVSMSGQDGAGLFAER